MSCLLRRDGACVRLVAAEVPENRPRLCFVRGPNSGPKARAEKHGPAAMAEARCENDEFYRIGGALRLAFRLRGPNAKPKASSTSDTASTASLPPAM